MIERSFAFPEVLGDQIKDLIEREGYSLSQPQHIAQAVMDVSDHFQSSSRRQTPWATPSHRVAYLAYFLPLNFLRLSALFFEARRVSFPLADHVFDFGSGPGTAHLAAINSSWLHDQAWTHVEISTQAQTLHKHILGPDLSTMAGHQWTHQMPARVPRKSALVASYSLNELEGRPDWFHQFDHLVLLEPSTMEIARRLMSLREQLIKGGYFVWAPCTHQAHCPLLKHSQRDWCHDRIVAHLPPWFDALEEFLPMKNRTLTFSYLLMSKVEPPKALLPRARVIGDTLRERGKWRQAICRGSDREFLSWLTRHGEPEVIPHGELIVWPQDARSAGNEWRPQGVVQRADS